MSYQMHYCLRTKFIVILFFIITLLISSEICLGFYIQTDDPPPFIIDFTVNPKKVRPGNIMTVSAIIIDPNGCKNVHANFFHELGYDKINLSLITGSIYNGKWTGKWVVHDTKIKEYSTIITASSNSGHSSSMTTTWWDPIEPWWNTEFKYRKQINLTEPQGLSRTNTHVLITVDLDTNRLNNENGSALVYNGEQIPFDAYATSSNSGWVTTLEGLAEIDITSASTIQCFLYYDPLYSASEILPSTTGWSYVGATSYSGPDYVDLDPIDVDCQGNDEDGQFTNVCGETDHIKLNEWCYFKSPQTGNLYFKTGSDDGSGLWLDNSLIVENDGPHSQRWRDSSAQSLVNGKYYALEINWAEHQGQQMLYNRWDTTAGDNSNGNIIDNEAFPFYGDEWLIEVEVSDNEEVANPEKPTLQSPQNNSATNDITPIFQWAVGENTENLFFIIDDEEDLSDGDEYLNISLDKTETDYTILSGNALSEGDWYWKIVANNSQSTNSSDIWNFKVDTSPPFTPGLISPEDSATFSDRQINFQWNETSDDVSGSGRAHYQIQIAKDINFSQIIVNDNSTENNVISKTITESDVGTLYWRVRTWDNAGNSGSWSENKSFTIFDFYIEIDNEDSIELQLMKGQSRTIILSLMKSYSGNLDKQINLSSSWLDDAPTGIDVSFDSDTVSTSNGTVITIDITDEASTGSFVLQVKGQWNGLNRTALVEITSIGMLFSIDSFPQDFYLLRDDMGNSTISIDFELGKRDEVYLSGSWSSDVPSGISVSLSRLSGTPSFKSKLTFSSSKSAEAGNFIYKVTGTGSGLTKSEYFSINISTDLSLTLNTDKNEYEKGENIEITGTVNDPQGLAVKKGTIEITLSTKNWTDTISTSINNGEFSKDYYITFDKPSGIWDMSVVAEDIYGHETNEAISTTFSVINPEKYDQYNLTILDPVGTQTFNRGDTISFMISCKKDNVKVQDAKMNVWFEDGKKLTLTEKSTGIYSGNYFCEYDTPIGIRQAYIESKKIIDEKVNVGFTTIDYEIKPVEPIITIIEPATEDIIEKGENILIKIKVEYPNGYSMENAIISIIDPLGNEQYFQHIKSGIYETDIDLIGDLENWTMEINAQDIYGNQKILETSDLNIVESKITTLLFNYWWALTVIISVLIFLIFLKLKKIFYDNRIKQLRINIENIKDFKKRNAIMYFIKGEINRENYDRIHQEYEAKQAHLLKKLRILNRKLKKGKK